MHELSIAMSILDLARREASAQGAKRVSELEIEVGKLTGVDSEALAFVLESVVRDTEFADCRFTIRVVNGRCICNICRLPFAVDTLADPCPHCGSSDKELVAGKELRLKSLVVD
jgi:hydrogenase nickel incorporation protein HypA/HybF